MMLQSTNVFRMLAASLTLALLAPASSHLAAADHEHFVNEGDSIQAAVNGAEDDDIIFVGPGTYEEDVTVDKRLTIEGANAGISAGTHAGTRGAESVVVGGFRVTADDVTIDGFFLEIGVGPLGIGDQTTVFLSGDGGHVANNIILGEGQVAPNRGVVTITGAVDTEISNNEVSNWQSGIYLNPGSGIQIWGNSIHSNFAGIGSDGISDVEITGNIFADNDEGFGASNVGASVFANFNDFDGNAVGVAHYGGETIDATDNYWGHASGPSNRTNPKGKAVGKGDGVVGDVLWDPWLRKSITNPSNR